MTEYRYVKMPGGDLRGLNLTADRFHGCDFSRAVFSDTRLDRSAFIDCNLTGAYIERTSAVNASFIRSSLQGASIRNSDFTRTQFDGGLLQNANLYNTQFTEAELRRLEAGWLHATTTLFDGARVEEANFNEVQFRNVDLRGATLDRTIFAGSLLESVDMRGSTWRNSDLSRSMLYKIECDQASFEDVRIFGVGICWVNGTPRKEHNLNAAPGDQRLFVNDLKLAPLLYEVHREDALDRLIRTLTDKVVLILGRFTDEPKKILDAIHERLHCRNYIPALIDFDPGDRLTSTHFVRAVAMCSRFIVADVTDAKVVIAEVLDLLPLRTIVVKPLVRRGQQEPVQLTELRRDYSGRLLDTHVYDNAEALLNDFDEAVIRPCEEAVARLAKS